MKATLITALLATTMIAGIAAAQTTEPKEAPGSAPTAQRPEASTPDRAQGTTAPRDVGPKTNQSGQAPRKTDGSPARQGQAPAESRETQKDTSEKRETKAQGQGKSQAQERAQQDLQRDRATDRDDNVSKEGAKDSRDSTRTRADERDSNDNRGRAEDNRRDRENVRERAEDRPRDRDNARDRAGTREDESRSKRGSVSLSSKQEISVRRAFDRQNIRRVTNVNFNISAGTVIPRSVTLYALPTSIVQIVPQYRGYRYIAVEDEIIIVHPQTYRIVTVIPVDGPARASRGGGRMEISSAQRQRIRSFAVQGCQTVVTAPTFDLTIGVRIPEAYELCPFDEVVVRDVQVVRPYRYLIVQDEVVLVDPSTNMIVEVIR